MTDRLHDVLPRVERLPSEVREEAASYIETVAETLDPQSPLDVAAREQIKTILRELRAFVYRAIS